MANNTSRRVVPRGSVGDAFIKVFTLDADEIDDDWLRKAVNIILRQPSKIQV